MASHRHLIRSIQHIHHHLRELQQQLQHPPTSTFRVLQHLQQLHTELQHLKLQVVQTQLKDHLHDPDWVLNAQQALRVH